ncbi:MAG: hypothetical protein OXT67_02400 [Zetaproteobacteria bacterium]|nr:hypothetical protein [Zetaproteobacteria bacterium]
MGLSSNVSIQTILRGLFFVFCVSFGLHRLYSDSSVQGLPGYLQHSDLQGTVIETAAWSPSPRETPVNVRVQRASDTLRREIACIRSRSSRPNGPDHRRRIFVASADFADQLVLIEVVGEGEVVTESWPIAQERVLEALSPAESCCEGMTSSLTVYSLNLLLDLSESSYMSRLKNVFGFLLTPWAMVGDLLYTSAKWLGASYRKLGAEFHKFQLTSSQLMLRCPEIVVSDDEYQSLSELASQHSSFSRI